MKNIEFVKKWNDLFFSGDKAAYLDHMSEDFQFSGPVPEPIGREAYTGLMLTLKNACPDLNNNFVITGASGNQVKASVIMEGTHTADLDLSAMHLPVFPATNQSFRLPKEPCTITVEDGKITRFHAVVGEGGGLMGILSQLGIEMPG